MATVLSLPPSTSSLLAPRPHGIYGQSCGSAASVGSSGTMQHHTPDYGSTDSFRSSDSTRDNTLRRYPNQTLSELNFRFSPSASSRKLSAADENGGRSESKRETVTVSGSPPHASVQSIKAIQQTDVDDSATVNGQNTAPQPLEDPLATLPIQDASCGKTEQALELTAAGSDNVSVVKSNHAQTFRRWISRLRRRNQRSNRPVTTAGTTGRWAVVDFDAEPRSSARDRRSSHQKSSSHSSSIRFVQAVRSATETIASASIATVSRRNSKWHLDTRRSSVTSGPDARVSIDSQPSIIDEIAKQRSQQRRQKLEELISTEESYLADVKALSDAYSTILAHHPTQASYVRLAAQRTLTDILHLHDDILGQLHQVVPFAEFDQTIARPAEPTPQHLTHVRWHSVDIVPPRPIRGTSVAAKIRHGRRSLNLSRMPDDAHASILQCSPQTIASVAKVFMANMSKFTVYREYGINYDLVQRDVDETQQSICTWEDFDRAIEALSTHVNPVKSRVANSKRAMTVKDLLIKPIQRLPRYELLFSDLRKLTPVCDDPEAHTIVAELLSRLNEICRRMNEAKDDPNRARMLQTSFLIEDRLTFSNQVSRSVFSQLLGHVQLCGCLYIAYRGRDRMKGRYVICVLFQSTLLLACAEGEQQKYDTIAGINLASATIEETDNVKGLQCHTAPHAWKIVFEHAGRMYEMIVVACSAIEADVWRTRLVHGMQSQSEAVASGAAHVVELQSPLTVEMRSIGQAFDKPGNFARRVSVHRSATVGPTTDLNQVIIENTEARREVQGGSSQTSVSIARSQSTGTSGHVQTLAPRRAERYRLENMLTDVWTRDLLPYPGLVRRTDPLRASANHVIRKFSMASIASNFSSSKRSASHASINSWRKEALASKPKRPGNTSPHRKSLENGGQSQLVDFHNAPEAFLPADFGLQEVTAKRKPSGIRSLTMTMERPFSPRQHSGASTALSPSRAQSVRNGVRYILSPMSSSIPSARESQPKSTASYQDEGRNDVCTSTPHPSHSQSTCQDGDGNKCAKKSRSIHRLFQRLTAELH